MSERPRQRRTNESGADETTGYGAAVSEDELAARRATAKLQDTRGLGAGPKKPSTTTVVDESKLDPLQRAILARKRKQRTGSEAAAALGNR